MSSLLFRNILFSVICTIFLFYDVFHPGIFPNTIAKATRCIAWVHHISNCNSNINEAIVNYCNVEQKPSTRVVWLFEHLLSWQHSASRFPKTSSTSASSIRSFRDLRSLSFSSNPLSSSWTKFCHKKYCHIQISENVFRTDFRKQLLDLRLTCPKFPCTHFLKHLSTVDTVI